MSRIIALSNPDVRAYLTRHSLKEKSIRENNLILNVNIAIILGI